MNRHVVRKLAYVLLAVSSILLAGCESVIRASEEQYMRPGALDPALPTDQTIYRQYKVKFLDKHRISFRWYGSTGCHVGGVVVDQENAVLQDGVTVRRLYTPPITMNEGKIFAAPFEPEDGFDDMTRFFRSVKRNVPVHPRRDGKTDFTQVIGYEDREEGLRATCLEHWVGLNMAIALRFFDRTVDEWIGVLESDYAGMGGKRGRETIGKNIWTTYTVPIQPAKPNNVSGPYKFYILPVADSGFTFAFSLGANHRTLNNRQGFSAIEALFHRVLESVQIEPWTDQDQVEHEALRILALEVSRKRCLSNAAKGYTTARWCHKYLR